MTSYKNPCFRPGKSQYGPEFYETTARAEIYGEHLIYRRTEEVWDVVKDGVCVTQMAGINGAKKWIDSQQSPTP